MRYDIHFLSVFQTWLMVVSAQNAIGIPRIISQSKEPYRAGTKDLSGMLYFTNDDGWLTMTGISENSIPSPNQHSQVSDGGFPEHRNEKFRSFTVAGGWLNQKKCGQELWNAGPRPRPVYPQTRQLAAGSRECKIQQQASFGDIWAEEWPAGGYAG